MRMMQSPISLIRPNIFIWPPCPFCRYYLSLVPSIILPNSRPKWPCPKNYQIQGLVMVRFPGTRKKWGTKPYFPQCRHTLIPHTPYAVQNSGFLFHLFITITFITKIITLKEKEKTELITYYCYEFFEIKQSI